MLQGPPQARVSATCQKAVGLGAPFWGLAALMRSERHFARCIAQESAARAPESARAAQCDAPVALQQLAHGYAEGAAAPLAVTLAAAVVVDARGGDARVLPAEGARGDSAALRDQHARRGASRRGCCACCGAAARRRAASSRAGRPYQRRLRAAGPPKRPAQQRRAQADAHRVRAAACGQPASRQHGARRLRPAADQLRAWRHEAPLTARQNAPGGEKLCPSTLLTWQRPLRALSALRMADAAEPSHAASGSEALDEVRAFGSAVWSLRVLLCVAARRLSGCWWPAPSRRRPTLRSAC